MATRPVLEAVDALQVAAASGLIDADTLDVDLNDPTELLALIRSHEPVLVRFGIDPLVAMRALSPERPGTRVPLQMGLDATEAVKVTFDAARDVLVVTGVLADSERDEMLVGAPAARRDRKTGVWLVPAGQAHGVVPVMGPRWVLDRSAQAAVTIAAERALADEDASRALTPVGDLVIPGLASSRPLRPFQLAAVEYLVRKKQAFDCDPPGLGKTVTALSALAVLNTYPAVIVTKAKLRLNWGREIESWFPDLTYRIVEGRKQQDLGGVDLVVVNYDIVQYRLEDLLAVSPLALVNDESHSVKERAVTGARMEAYRKAKAEGKKPKRPPGSQRTWALKELSRDVRSRDGAVFNLTATPRPNRNRELWPQIEILGLGQELGGWKRWATRYCDLKKRYGREDADGSINKVELNSLLRQVGMVARKKSDVLPQLPPILEVAVEMDLDAAIYREYQQAEADIVTFLSGKAAELAVANGEDPRRAAWLTKLRTNYAKEMVALTTLRQLAAAAKITSVVDYLTDYVTDNPLTDGAPTKFVVFGYHVATQNALLERLPSAVAIRSSDLQTDRQAEQAKAAFMEDPDTRFIVIGPGAMEGHTLTAAQHVVLAELPWNAASVEQIAGRCVAAGQPVTTKRGPVPVQDVKVGDLVLTHLGNWKPVTGVYARTESDLVELDVTDVPAPLVCTPDHRVWTKEPSGAALWKQAGDLHPGDLVSTPTRDPQWCEVRGVKAHQAGETTVHDLTVESDHSFVVGGVAVHNSYGRLNNARSITLTWLLSSRTVDQRVYDLIQTKGADEASVVHGEPGSGDDRAVEDELLLYLANRNPG